MGNIQYLVVIVIFGITKCIEHIISANKHMELVLYTAIILVLVPAVENNADPQVRSNTMFKIEKYDI